MINYRCLNSIISSVARGRWSATVADETFMWAELLGQLYRLYCNKSGFNVGTLLTVDDLFNFE